MKVSFLAKDPGIYKIIWSNEHSWFKGKTLKYKVSVLKPVPLSINDLTKKKSQTVTGEDKQR